MDQRLQELKRQLLSEPESEPLKLHFLRSVIAANQFPFQFRQGGAEVFFWWGLADSKLKRLESEHVAMRHLDAMLDEYELSDELESSFPWFVSQKSVADLESLFGEPLYYGDMIDADDMGYGNCPFIIDFRLNQHMEFELYPRFIHHDSHIAKIPVEFMQIIGSIDHWRKYYEGQHRIQLKIGLPDEFVKTRIQEDSIELFGHTIPLDGGALRIVSKNDLARGLYLLCGEFEDPMILIDDHEEPVSWPKDYVEVAEEEQIIENAVMLQKVSGCLYSAEYSYLDSWNAVQIICSYFKFSDEECAMRVGCTASSIKRYRKRDNIGRKATQEKVVALLKEIPKQNLVELILQYKR